MNKSITLILGMFILMIIPFASAIDWDNVFIEGNINPNTGYPNIEIKNCDLWAGIPGIIGTCLVQGETLFEGSLTEHTPKCGENCYSTIEINHAGGVLINNIEFRTLIEDDYVIQPIRNYKFKYETELPEYETECIDNELPNGTIQQDCTTSQVGTYTGFKNYNVGEEVPAGNYELFLEGSKKPSRSVDWVIKVQGRWLEEWAVWGDEGIIYQEDANVTWTTGSFSGGLEANTYDGNFGTSATAGGSDGNLYLNYTKIPNKEIVTWRVKDEGGEFNLTIPQACYDYAEDIQLRARAHKGIGAKWYCWDGAWDELRAYSGNELIYEEGIFWNSSATAEVTLNFPTDNYLSPTNLIEFNCSTKVTGGATLTNISLFTNESGTWEAKNTTQLSIGGEGLISYYDLDESSGDAIDSYGSNNGNVLGTSYSATGKINTAYDWDATTDRVNLGGTIISSTTAFSVSLWVNMDDVTNGGMLIGNGDNTDGFYLYHLGSGGWFTARFGGTGFFHNSNPGFSNGVWAHVVATYDGTNYRLYIDGVLKQKETGITGIAATNNLRIGNWASDSLGGDMKIDEVGIYGKKLSDSVDTVGQVADGEVAALYNSGAGSRPSESPITMTQTWNRTLTDAILWNCESCDSDGDCGFATQNRTLTIDTSVPMINLTSLNQTIPYGVIGLNETLNWTVTDINLDSCWYNYNGTNVSVVCNENTTNFILEEDNLNLTFYANDSLGTESSNFTNWSYNILETNVTFLPSITESESDFFQYFFQTTYLIESVQFNYGNTSYTASIFANGTNAWRLESTIQAPNVLTSTDFNFSFSIDTNFNGIVTSNNITQTVLPLNVDNCSTFTNLIITAALFDERTIENITGTVEANIELTNPSDGSLISKFTTNFENVHDFSVCTDVNLTQKDFLYDLELRYYQNGTGSNFNYVPEFYHIQNAATSTFPINIELFDLNVNESTEFTIEYRDDNYVKRPNVLLQILRRYVNEGISRTIEIPITSSEGTAVAHFDLNNYKYKIIVTEDGEVLNIFDNPTIRCESEISGICTISLKGLKGVPSAKGISEIVDFEYFPTQTATNISILFSSPSGSNKNVRVEMIQDSPFTDPIVLCNTTLFTSSGEIVCDTDDTIGDSSVSVNLYVDGVTVANLGTTVQEDLSDAWEGNNYFIGAMLILLLLGFSISSPQVMIWMGVFGLVLLGFLFLLNTANIGLFLGAITWLIVAATLVTIKINKRVES